MSAPRKSLTERQRIDVLHAWSQGKPRRGTVRRSKNGQRWCAQISYSGTQKYLGTFDSESEATAAIDVFVERHSLTTPLQWLIDHRTHKGDDCLFWPFGRGNAVWYRSIFMGDGRWSKAHRVMCELAHGDAPFPKAQAIHSCDNKRCLNPRHLRWGSPRANIMEAVERGRLPSGERSSRAMLTESDVRNARRDRDAGMTYQQLAEKYGISRGSMWHAVNGTQWKGVK